MEANLKHDPYAALRNPEFRLFIIGRLFAILALQIQGVIVGWQVYEITKDPLSLGLIGLCEFIPFIVVALFAGHIADITSRKRIIIICLWVLLICGILLYYITSDLSPGELQNNVSAIYCIIFITGLARGFIGPAIFAFMPQIIRDKNLYPNAISWNTSMWQAASVVGPAIGGIILRYVGLQNVYAIVSALLLSALFLFLFIKSRPVPESTETAGMVERLSVGIKFVFQNQLILTAISLDLFAVLFGGAVALLPIYASDILKVGAEGLGLLRAAPGIGAVIMMIILAYVPIKKDAGKKMLWAVAAFGICIIVFGLSTYFWLSMIMLILSGAFDSISVIVRNTLIHKLTPESMKGRVSAVNSVFVGSSNELGSFESGVLAKVAGTVSAVVIGGMVTLGVVGFTALKAKKLQDLDL